MKKNSFWRLICLFAPFLVNSPQLRRRTFFTACILCIDLMMTGLVPKMMQYIVQSLNQPESLAIPLGALFASFTLFWIISQIASYLMEITFFPVVNDAIKRLTFLSIERMHALSLLHTRRLESAEVLSATSRISLSARLFFKEVCVSVLPAAAKLIIALAMVWNISGINILFVTSLILCLGIVYMLLPYYVQTRRQAWAYTDARAVKMIDSLINTKIVRFAFSPEMNKLSDYLEREAEGWMKTVKRGNLLNILLTTIFGICTGSILYLAVVNQMYPIKEFVFLQSLLLGVFIQFRRAFSDIKSMAESYADVEKILALLDSPQTFEPLAFLPDANKSRTNIELHGVTFAYPNCQPLLNNISFSITAGEKIGIVGSNGSGKSTLCHLIAGFYTPSQGQVLVGGVDAYRLAQSNFSQMLYFLPQDQFLFHGTFYENLIYGAGRPSKDKVAEAILATQLQPVIDKLPQGLHSPLGEFGKLLSGGEKQRLALARALILQPHILICDESLNSIDSKTELRILESLFERISTVIIISHRETSLSLCDKIFEVKEGGLFSEEWTKMDRNGPKWTKISNQI